MRISRFLIAYDSGIVGEIIHPGLYNWMFLWKNIELIKKFVSRSPKIFAENFLYASIGEQKNLNFINRIIWLYESNLTIKFMTSSQNLYSVSAMLFRLLQLEILTRFNLIIKIISQRKKKQICPVFVLQIFWGIILI